MPSIPAIRVSAANNAPIRDGDYVLYWMIAARRAHDNFALEHALHHAEKLGRPLIVFEPLRAGYRWASDRHHAFVIEGMADNARDFAALNIAYYPYVEPTAGAGKGLLEALAKRASVVVTDEFPCFFLPDMVAAAANKLPVRLEVVDGNGLLPLRASEKPYPSAALFRRHLQKTLPAHFGRFPLPYPAVQPERAHIPLAVVDRWRPAPAAALADVPALLAGLPIDHTVPVVHELVGGSARANAELEAFLPRRLSRYADERSEPASDASSGLSPWLHFGHLSVHRVVAAIYAAQDAPRDVFGKVTGTREGWWPVDGPAQAFLDELVTWRELGYHFGHHRKDYADYASLPEWVRQTLGDHASDPRAFVYSREQLEGARTHDRLWNAAQRQLRAEGRIHNYLRMLWGKKILEWSPSPEAALEHLIELNNRWALDGRDPNSYSGIFWTLGRFDRPWGPVRPIFGTIRYMSSDNTAKKFDVGPYLARWGTARA